MRTALCYFTGTGNTLAVARELAAGLEDAELLSMTKVEEPEVLAGVECIGLLSPVYVWGLPRAAARFLRTMQAAPDAYLFGVVTCGGTPGPALSQMERLLERRGLTLSAGWSIRMPSNYIVAGGADPVEEQEECFARASEQIVDIQAAIGARETMPVARPPLGDRIKLTLAYNLSLPNFRHLDRMYRVDETCNGCGICARVCPVGNIELVGERPQWQHRCEQCFACLQWCPQQAIQFGKNTADRERYHHPQVSVKDMT